MRVRVRMMPVVNGIAMLSLIGVGNDSTIIPVIAPMKALIGSMKKVAPRKAKMKPKIEPSRFFDLLNGYRVPPSFFPKHYAQSVKDGCGCELVRFQFDSSTCSYRGEDWEGHSNHSCKF